VTGSSLRWSAVDGRTYTFNLGDLTVGADGWFSIDVEVPCDIELAGLTHCSEAHIYPDSACLPPNPLWSGATVDVQAECRDTALVFRLKNTGTVDMSQALDYVVIEDAVLMKQGAFLLDANEVMEISAPNNGATYHFSAQQEPYAPYASRPLLTVEGCGFDTLGGISTGYVVQFPLDENEAAVASHCAENVGSYDPNQKTGYPTGVGAAHTVAAGEAIDYVIQFQNTGTDTAFRVVLLDQLSEHLDALSLRPGASSHPYTYELLADGLARFIFDPIALVDSATNEAASQGFVQFRIAHKPGLAPGTEIKNTAGIVFDQNPAITTNTTLHTIGVPYTVAVIDAPKPAGSTGLRIGPNPFADVARFELGVLPAAPAVLRVFDGAGREVRTQEFAGRSAWFRRESLPAGLYFFTVEAGSKRLASGRLIAN
jgi:uncharacterized repeat protein (TIGR01451 family)